MMTEPPTAEPPSYISDATQTRFSFYNASEFTIDDALLEGPGSSNDAADSAATEEQQQQPLKEALPQKQEPQRFTFYGAGAETPKAEHLMKEDENGVALQPSHDATTVAETAMMDDDVVIHPDASLLHDNDETQLESQRPSPDRRSSCSHRQSSYLSQANPYEDAIREALELLRKHRTTIASSDATASEAPCLVAGSDSTPPNQDWLLQARRTPNASPSHGSSGNNSSRRGSPLSEFSQAGIGSRLVNTVYQADIESRRQQRQERMAKYANRLAEIKQQDNASIHDGSNSDDDDFLGVELDSDAEIDTVHPSTSDEASVQAGVERVLLAILERAGSRGRQPQAASSERRCGSEMHHPTHVQAHSSWSRGEEKKSVDDENALLQAMSDLLGTSSILSQPPHQQQQRHPSNGYDPVTASRSMDSVEPDVQDEKRQEEHDDGEDFLMPPPRLARATITHLDTSMEAVEAVASLESSLPNLELQHVPTAQSQDHDELDELVRQFSSATSTTASQRHVIKHPIEERVRQILSSDSSKDRREDTGRVPDGMMKTCAEVEQTKFYRDGPLSDDELSPSTSDHDEESSLDSSFDEDDAHQHDSSVDRVLGPLAKSNTTTGVVLELDSPADSPEASNGVFDTISAVMSLVTGDAPVSPTSTEASRDRYADADDDASSESDESTDSDESDFSEANDLMRSLCAHLLPVGVDQTCRVLDPLPEWDSSNPDEPGYRIVRLRGAQLRRVEEEFDTMVVKLKRQSQRDLSKLGKDTGSDAVFERDLKAAEDLLDQDEVRMWDAEAEDPTALALVPRNQNGDVDASTEQDRPLPSFPGLKSAGKGKIGDLECFHLPVIFKSHVTGFEPTKDMYLESGHVVAGQYLVQGELGSAAFSTAYRCVDLSSQGDGPDGHEEVCLKVIKNTKDFFDQSLDEIKILELLRQTGLCHEKSIVEMKTFFYYREHLIIVTELLRQNLFEFGKFVVDHNEEPYFTLPRLAYITRQCLVALEFVHSLLLVHSDIKPENILLGDFQHATVKLIDFGSSCYLTDRQSSYIQSRSYRAPEVVLGLPYDGRIDIWSLGCVVAEMFTGEVTFQNDSIVSMLSRIEAICGPFPRHMIAQGRQSGRFFTKCGLLFERVVPPGEGDTSRSDTDESIRENFDIFQPKTTTLSTRLGLDRDLMEQFNSGETLTEEQKQQIVFVDFVRNMLTIEPEARPTASEALGHPWMVYASTLTEDDIKYPSIS